MADDRKDADDTPRQPPWDTVEDAVSLPAEGGFTPQEHWAWARLLRGMPAAMYLYPGTERPPVEDGIDAFQTWLDGKLDGGDYKVENANDWPETRILSERFLRTILFHAPWAETVETAEIDISGARIEETLDWTGRKTLGGLSFLGCRFSKDVVLRSVRIKGLFSLRSCHFSAAIEADRLTVDGGLRCTGRFVVNGDIRLLSARVGGDVSFVGAQLEGGLQADQLAVDGSLYCQGGFVAKGDIRLVGARIGGDVSFVGAQLEGALEAHGLTVDRHLFCQDGFVAKDEIGLLGARIGGDVSFVDAQLEGRLYGDSLSVADSVYLREVKRLGDVHLSGATIGQHLQLRESLIEGRINFTGAQINGELHLAKDSEKPGPIWGDDASLILRNAHARAIGGNAKAFQRGDTFIDMDLTGFTYDRIGGLGDTGGFSLAVEPPKVLRAWLKATRAKGGGYTPEPYRQLSQALDRSGRRHRAEKVRIAMRWHEMVCAFKQRDFYRGVLSLFSGVLIGFGMRNWRAVAAFFALIMLASAWGLYREGLTQWSFTWASFDAVFDWIWFSLGNSLPIIQLDEGHKTFLLDRLVDDEARKTMTMAPIRDAWVFYTQKVFSLILLTYLAAGLSGLAGRGER